ncbi:MAG TPA: hypothetical protein VFX62_01505 [Erythrobacter sp.]|nr:hypothetical protein [Erythrobacter sp.]
MIEQFDTQLATDCSEPLSGSDIVHAWTAIAGWMVMRHDHGLRIKRQGTSEQVAQPDRKMGRTASSKATIVEIAPPGIEKDGVEALSTISR